MFFRHLFLLDVHRSCDLRTSPCTFSVGVHSLCTVALNLPHQEGCSRSDPVDGAASGGEDGRIPLWCVDTYSKSLCFVLISLCLKRPLLGISSQFILFQTRCNLTMKTALTYDFHTDNHQHVCLWLFYKDIFINYMI